MIKPDCPNGACVQLNLPADYRCLGVLSAAVAAVMQQTDDVPDAETLTYDIQLAVQEACANIVGHAYENQDGGRIEAIVGRLDSPRSLIVHLYDTGASFDPQTVDRPDLNQAHTGGYGLYLMRTLLDEVAYEREAERNHWQLVKRL